MSILYLTDTHIRAKASRMRKDNIIISLQTKLDEVASIANEMQVSYVIHGGDIFHSSVQSISSIKLFLGFLEKLECPFYSLIGNHDVVGKNQHSIDRTLLGIIAHLQNPNRFRLLVSESNQVDLGDVVLYGLSIEPGLDSRNEVLIESEKPVILAIHSMLVPKTFPSEHIPIEKFKTNAKVVLCSHYHPGFPISTIGETTFVAPGALHRLEATSFNFNRIPQVAYISTESDEVKYIPLVSAPKDIFITTNLQGQEKMVQSIEDYVDSFNYMDTLSILELDRLPAVIGEQAGFSSEVIERLEELLKEESDGL